MKNAITGVFILLILSIPFIAYNAFVVIPKEKLEAAAQQAQLKIEEERRANEERIQNIKQCEADAWETYSLNWDNACKTLGKEKDCTLPLYLSTNLDEGKERDEDRCSTLYR